MLKTSTNEKEEENSYKAKTKMTIRVRKVVPVIDFFIFSKLSLPKSGEVRILSLLQEVSENDQNKGNGKRK